MINYTKLARRIKKEDHHLPKGPSKYRRRRKSRKYSAIRITSISAKSQRAKGKYLRNNITSAQLSRV